MPRRSSIVSPDVATSDFVLNIAPIQFEDAQVRAGFLKYESQQQLDSLRAEHRSTHVFWRENGSTILCVPTHPDAPALGTRSEDLRLWDNLDLCAALIRNALLNFLCRKGRQSLGYDPIQIVGNESNDNILATATPFGCPEWLAIRPLYDLAVRVFEFDNQPALVGVALDLRTQYIIDLSCDELAAQGVVLTGLNVGRRIEQDDVRLAPRFEVLGRVKGMAHGQLLLTDARTGLDSVEDSAAFLEPTGAALDRCLDQVFRQHSVRIKQELDTQIAIYLSGPKKLQKLTKIVERFSRLKLEMIPGVTFTIQPFLAQKDADTFPTIETATKPIYIFDSEGTHTQKWGDVGLKEHGPYSGQNLAASRPQICIICQRHRKEQVERFLDKFLHGIPPSKREKSLFTEGFLQKYALADVPIEYFLTNGSSADAYHRAAPSAIGQQGAGERKWNLALIQTDEFFSGLDPTSNPSIVAKANFLEHGIPTHDFEIESTNLKGGQLGYFLNNMALACYAKLGGTPWLLQTDSDASHELVIGLANIHVGGGRLNDSKRIVGIATLFTGDGNYLFVNLSLAVPTRDYEDALLSALQVIISQAERDMNWKRGERVRLVFHALNPLKDAELNAVRQVVADLSKYEVEFAFLQIVEDHPYVVFDQKQRGTQDYETHMMKGAFAPARGSLLRLSDEKVLISLTGAKEIERVQGGMPHPVLLRLHPDSSFRNMNYLVQQVFALSWHSWQSFSPAQLPVTLLYPELIARRLNELVRLPRWDLDLILGRMDVTRWFL